MPKRPHPESSSSPGRRRAPKPRPLAGLRVHIINAKLSNELDEPATLHRLAESLGANVNSALIEEADVIVTRIATLKRFQRHIDLDQARSKNVVKPDWLMRCQDTMSCCPYADFIAIPSLYEDIKTSGASSFAPPPPPVPSAVSPSVDHAPSTGSLPNSTQGTIELSWKNSYSTHRLSPLICPNQDLIAELGIVRRKRELEGESQSASAYQRAIAGIKSYPTKIQNANEVLNIPACGPSVARKVFEFLRDGVVSDAERARNDEKFRSTSEFITVYGIGPVVANKLYAEGHRSLEDLKARFMNSKVKVGIRVDRVEAHFPIEEALKLRDELQIKISRAEVEEIANEVLIRLARIGRGFEYTICGGYRRGKELSNDVDIVITRRSSDVKDIDHICQYLVSQLQEAGLITHLVHLSTSTSQHGLFRTKDGMKTHPNFDTLDKALTVFKMNDRPDRVHRRLDLIFAPWAVYWTAVVGWTGSTQFERDLRKWSKSHCGIKFDSCGMVTLNDTKPVYAHSEKEVFDILDLPWIDPTMRNADL